MKRLAVTLAVVAACACTPRTEPEPRSLADRARLAIWRGELAEARTLAEQGLALPDAQERPDRQWTFRLLQAEALVAARDLDGAKALLAGAPPAGAEFDAIRGRHHYLEARLAQMHGEMPRALELLERARALAGSDLDLALDVAVQDGQVRLQLRQWAEGESRLQAAAARAASEGRRYHEAVAYHNLGMGHLVRNRYDEALAWFERTLSFTDLEPLTVYATALSNAGICYSRLGQFERALATQRRAVDIHARGGRPQYLEQALGSLGITHGLRGEADAGLPYLQRAMRVAADANLTADAALWAGNLSGMYILLGRWDEAEQFNDESTRLLAGSKTGEPVYNILNAAEIAAGRGDPDAAARLFEAALGAGDAPSVQWSAHAGLARVALVRRRPEQAFDQFETAIRIVEKTRSDLLQADYRVSFVSRLITLYQDYVEALVAAGRPERALEVAESSRGRVLAERHGVPTPLSARATTLVRTAGRSGAVLLSYWLAPQRSSVWVVRGDGIRRFDLPPASDLAALVAEHRTAIDSALADPIAGRDTPGDRLFRSLVAPAAALIPRGARVVIAADGALHGLSFETLPVDGPTRHYWIEDVEVQTAPSLALLDAAAAPRADAASLLLIGDALPSEPEFPALRYAPMEMQGVARHFAPGSVRTFAGGAASPGAFRDGDPASYRYIHFTAHATANRESPLDSAVILSGSGTDSKLYARDVAATDLRAELVTVSACRSAGERAYSGEGLVGFAWAFLRAGSRRVIAGLWDVDDQSTASLMDALYERLAAGDPPARALRSAKLALIRAGGRTARPYYWAPLQLFTIAL